MTKAVGGKRSHIPVTLVEKEAASALRLSMPAPENQGDFIYLEAAPERFNTPIARTLTEEFLRRDPQRCPSVAVRHVPVNDPARDMLSRAVSRSHGSSPRAAHEEPKGRPTPKRPRKRGAQNGASQGH